MDVAVFVGFAASGPLHVPVVIEDPATYTAIFGPDLPLAWDRQSGEPAYAYLGPAVRSFFRCGGRRCYVIRVAGQAQSNRFPLPGMARAVVIAGEIADIRPAVAQARSEGSWSDGLRVSTVLLSRTVAGPEVSESAVVISSGDISEGDLLRLTYREAGLTRLIVVGAVEAVETGGIGSPPSPRRAALRAAVKHSLWLAELDEAGPSAEVSQAKLFGRVENGEDAAVSCVSWRRKNGQWYKRCGSGAVEVEPGPAAATANGEVVYALHLPLSLADAPPAGSLITVDLGTECLLLAVDEVRSEDADSGSPAAETIRITCRGVRWLKTAPMPAGQPLMERLSFELRARQSAGDPYSLSDLAFSPEHPRSWTGPFVEDQSAPVSPAYNGLPTDHEWFTAVAAQDTVPDLWKQAAEPRCPVAGGLPSDGFTFPFAMSVLPFDELRPYPAADDALTRDGLSVFETALFLDEALAGTTTLDLAGRADFLRYLSPAARALTGIHAAMAIEEATLIAVPDGLHRGWTHEVNPTELTPQPSEPLTPPDWSKFVGCGSRVWPAPVLSVSPPDAAGTFILSWRWEPGEPTDPPMFTLEEATQPDFDGAITLYTGAKQTYPNYGRTRGDYYYRVRATAGGNLSDWSNGEGVRVAPGSQWTLNDPSAETDQVCLTLHRALIRLCAARGDMVAVLAMPEHFREEQALAHAQALTPFSTRLNPDDLFDFPLSFAEARALTYAALYHPWLHTRDGQTMRAVPPDGAMCGMIARRAIERGAWIAPANEPVPGVLALTPPLAEERWLELLQAQINIIKPSPTGFIAQAADTLSLDDDLRPLNVRRLLILLRRLVLRRGAQYVFEPFDEVFRRMVQRGLESVLEAMYARGAFAGRTAQSAFQVVPRSTAQDIEQGRFIMDLRVAPSLPMEFLTVRLVQSGDRSMVSEER
jgi:hypothetical protein